MMAASARRVDSPHATTPHDADALHKMAAIAGAASANSTDENTPANGSAAAAKPHRKSSKNGEPPSKPHQHTSESDENDNDDDGDDDDGNDTDDKSKSPSKDGDDGDDDGDDDGKKSTSGGGAKKSRRELPPHTVAILKGWMLSPEHVKHPYPTDEDKQMLLKKTGINMKQLTNWFTNARKRIWKPMMRREHSRQLQSAMEYEKARPRGDVPPFGAVGGAGGPMGGGAPPPGVPMHYRDAPMYPPRPAIRHSFDAGSMPPPGYHPHHHPYDMAGGGPPPPHHPHAYAGGGGAPPPPHPHAAAYPPRVMRSVSESGHGEMDDYIDALRIRKRVHEMSPDAVDSEHGGGDKRYRRASGLSPASVKILQDWVAAHAHLEFPVPADSDKLQLSRDTGLDVQQIELWFKNNVGRYGAPLQAPPPQAQPPMQHPHQAYRSIPTRDNPMYPPPPAYGERRSIPSQGNPMFPPRPAARSSIPGAGNPQFPPPPAVRRDSSDGYRPGMPPPGYPGTPGYAAPPHPGYEGDGARPMRTLSVNSGAYGHPTTPGAPSPTIPTPVGAPTSAASGLPSLTGRPMVPGGARPGPSMGQARDSRSHTLDMGQFAESRRRTMNFQDILSSTSSQQPQQPALVAPRPPIVGNGYDAARPPNAENMYPPTEVAAPYAQKMYDQQRSAVPVAPHPTPSGPQADHQAPR